MASAAESTRGAETTGTAGSGAPALPRSEGRAPTEGRAKTRNALPSALLSEVPALDPDAAVPAPAPDSSPKLNPETVAAAPDSEGLSLELEQASAGRDDLTSILLGTAIEADPFEASSPGDPSPAAADDFNPPDLFAPIQVE